LRSNSAVQELQSRNSRFERPDGLDLLERPDGPGSLERPACFGLIEDSFAIPTTVARAAVAWAAVKIEAPWFLRSPREVVNMAALQAEVVNMAALQASAVVARGEPVRSGMRRVEAVQSAPGEWVPRLEAAG
jgi:hypothetical protein